MAYEIRNYNEEYLDKHVKIGTTVYKEWKGQVQSSVDQLKRTYSNDNFDPSTKFYAFKGEEMVGFLTSTVQPQEEDQPLTARLEFPVVLDGEPGANHQLLDHALKILKSRGVGVVLSRASPHWGDTKEFVESYEYQAANVQSRTAEFLSEDITIEVDTSNVEQFNFARDIDSTLEAFKEVFSINDENQIENLRKQLETMDQQVHAIHAQSIIRDGHRVVGRQLMYSPKGNPENVLLGQVMALGENADTIRRQILAKNIEIAKERGLKQLTFSLFGKALEQEDELNQFGFKFEENVTMYKKKL